MDSIKNTFKMTAYDPKRTFSCIITSKTLVLALAIVIIYQMAYALDSISELERDYRIILLRPTGEFGEILKTLNKFDGEIQERDIYWFVFSDNYVKTNYQGQLQEKFYSEMLEKYFKDIEYNIVLIGKDGGIKQKSSYLDLGELFDLIDAMPMRQLEMKE